MQSLVLLILAFIGILIFFRFISYDWKSGETKVVGKLDSLRRRNKEYHPFNNVILRTPDGTTQIDHILISPYGIFVIETKDYKGWIFGDENQRTWTQSLYGPRYSSRKYQFINPIHQNYKHVKAVQNFLNIDQETIFNVVVFTGKAEFIREMPENVRSLNDLLSYIKSFKGIFFNSNKVEEFSKKISDYIEQCPISEYDHVKNLRDNKVHPICPRCGKPMVLREAKKGIGAGSKFWGCPNFPECRQTKKS